MDTETRIITLLADGKFHSGEELGEMLALTRSAIWKALKQIAKKFNLDVYAVKGKGYRFPRSVELLQSDAIKALLSPETHSMISSFEIYSTIASTHAYLLKVVKEQSSPGRVCFAEHQSAGKGRRGREWFSPFACNIYLSYLWQSQQSLFALSGLSLVVALGIIRALEAYGLEDLTVKWPNDIYWQGKKLAGVLLDVVGEAYGSSRVVVSLGLNLEMPENVGNKIDQAWTDISRITGQAVSRNQISGLVLNHLLLILQQFEASGFEHFMKEWSSYDMMAGEAIILHNHAGDIEGFSKGINGRGELLFERNGQLSAVQSGEVTLRLRA